MVRNTSSLASSNLDRASATRALHVAGYGEFPVVDADVALTLYALQLGRECGGGRTMSLGFLRTCGILAGNNLRKGSGRSIYLLAALAIAVAAWLMLAALAAPFVANGASTGAGVTITNGNQRSAPLPLHYASRIESVTGAHDVAWFTLMIVTCGANTQVTLNAWGGPGAATQASPSRHAMTSAVMHTGTTTRLGF